MARALDSLGDLALELQRGTGNAAGKDLALLVEELLEELCVLVVHIFDACLLEAAVLFLLYLYCRRIQEADVISLYHNNLSYSLAGASAGAALGSFILARRRSA